ncbi:MULTISPECIES: SPOR domain-containing protein [Gulosibacter]|uniref:SPOR domain-containing protein n=1 Tax=Gulosibacter sediminis TaxID=1729695 RepID=A0ABY4N3I1_9MICO|nr:MULTISPECIES: SPOR domain-containing protein [Gulosibacter]UQN16012.1 SPOR domain-containing protein [Gulosibacter sediminis]
MTEQQPEFWFNTRTGEVEEGKQSISSERLGPFPTREDAAHANDKLAENARKWAEEDAREDED